jgi:hypothetical protein
VVADYESEVLAAIESSGHVLTIKKVSWDDVISGAAFS